MAKRMIAQQQARMIFSPITGKPNLCPSQDALWRDLHVKTWGYNPWTGVPRKALDVASDQFGLLIVPPAEEVASTERRERTAGCANPTDDPFSILCRRVRDLEDAVKALQEKRPEEDSLLAQAMRAINAVATSGKGSLEVAVIADKMHLTMKVGGDG
jgi:hypothetical protein